TANHCCPPPFPTRRSSDLDGLSVGMSNLWRLSDARTRSISPENFTGEKGKGGMSTDGPAAANARDLGRGWKVSPYVKIKPGETRSEEHTSELQSPDHLVCR